MYHCILKRYVEEKHSMEEEGELVTESGLWLPAARKPILKTLGWWKGKFAYFRGWQPVGEGRLVSKG